MHLINFATKNYIMFFLLRKELKTFLKMINSQNMSENDFIMLYIYFKLYHIYILHGSVCDPGFHAFCNMHETQGHKHYHVIYIFLYVNTWSLILSIIKQYCNIWFSINSLSELVRTINLYIYIYIYIYI